MTITIIALCVVSWLIQLTSDDWFQWLAFSPAAGQHEPYRFLTTTFLHSKSPFHILFNMYALWVTGPFLERALGRWRFTALYLISALGGSVGVLALAGGPTSEMWYTAAIGASGAIFGLFGAMFIVVRRIGASTVQIIVLIAINLAIGFMLSNIAWQAHVGGLITGTALAAAYVFAPRAKRLAVSIGATAAMTIVLIAISYGVYAWANTITASLVPGTGV